MSARRSLPRRAIMPELSPYGMKLPCRRELVWLCGRRQIPVAYWVLTRQVRGGVVLKRLVDMWLEIC